MLRDNKIRNIVIVNDKNEPTGVISSIDIVNNIIAEGRNYRMLNAKEVMNSPALYVFDGDQVEDAYFFMLRKNTYSCPVVDNNKKFKGVLSFTEAIKHLTKKVN